ncbi:MAG: hypothetical protein GXO73_10245 [Calditrichaeota bacterium]|nr:hypothetical protein [Calditrichota bacterium]
MKYRCEANCLEGFIQILASNYLPHGYWFYVTGYIPENKDPQAVDRKLIEKYDIALSRQQRARRKKAGRANMHYLRIGPFFVLLATHGKHRFFEEERSSIRDIRKYPLQIGGYSITVKRGQFLKKPSPQSPAPPDGRYRVRVQISRRRYRELMAHFLELAAHRRAETIAREFWNVPFEPYAPIRKQLLQILRRVNSVRAAMGYDQLPPDVIRYQRRIVRPFDTAEQQADRT